MSRNGKKMQIKLEKEDERRFREILTEMCRNSRLLSSEHFIQHGTTSVFRHSVAVAYVSFYIARKYHVRVREKALIRGALLHDYFLYDWKALRNAMEDFELSEIEQDTIARHMFPLNPIPPRHREAWIVCLADKICSGGETADGFLNWLDGIMSMILS